MNANLLKQNIIVIKEICSSYLLPGRSLLSVDFPPGRIGTFRRLVELREGNRLLLFVDVIVVLLECAVDCFLKFFYY